MIKFLNLVRGLVDKRIFITTKNFKNLEINLKKEGRRDSLMNRKVNLINKIDKNTFYLTRDLGNFLINIFPVKNSNWVYEYGMSSREILILENSSNLDDVRIEGTPINLKYIDNHSWEVRFPKEDIPSIVRSINGSKVSNKIVLHKVRKGKEYNLVGGMILENKKLTGYGIYDRTFTGESLTDIENMLKKYFKKESKDKSWLEEAKIEFLKSSEIELFLMRNSELDIFSKVKILPNSFFLVLEGVDAKNFDRRILKNIVKI